MADRTSIEWTDATWTPVKGCTRVSEGCRNCYAEIMAARFSGPGQWGEGLASIVQTPSGADHRWTGKVRFDEAELVKPLRWRKPRRIFVCSTSDLFHESVPDEWIDKVFAVMALAPQHTFQVLTKRPERMRDYLATLGDGHSPDRITNLALAIGYSVRGYRGSGGLSARPLPNVWLGVSVEDQATADARVPLLLETPAAIRWASYEPALGQIDWTRILPRITAHGEVGYRVNSASGFLTDAANLRVLRLDASLDWIVAGGESGPGARPMHPDWARQTRDQCAAAGVAFTFKQWGAWELSLDRDRDDPDWRRDYANDYVDRGKSRWINLEGGRGFHGERFCVMRRVGKKAAGRLLDGVLHDAQPETR